MRTLTPAMLLLTLAACIDPYIIDSGRPDTGSQDTGGDTDTGQDTDTDTDTNVGNGILRIHEVVDHADSAQVKYIELHNMGTGSIDMTGFSVHRYSNGESTSDHVELPGQLLPADGTYVICNSSGAEDFETLFGRAPSGTSSSINGNGDDVYALQNGTAVLDVFGQIGVDGSDEPWEYTDSVVKRAATAGPTPVFNVGEWTITPGTSAAQPFSPF